MSAGTFNVLLKSIEEPPPHTVWMLCAPSAEDLAPTIRSRCRVVTLAIPRASDVAELLVRRLRRLRSQRQRQRSARRLGFEV